MVIEAPEVEDVLSTSDDDVDRVGNAQFVADEAGNVM